MWRKDTITGCIFTKSYITFIWFNFHLFYNYRWHLQNCFDYGNGCVCSKSQGTHVQLRGLCEDSSIDTLFAPMNEGWDVTKLILRGIKQTTIKFDPLPGVWMLTNAWTNTTGISNAQKVSFALGVHTWRITGDQHCHDGQPYTAQLKLTACKEDEFSCHDGLCVSMDKRCDQNLDCKDLSDEMECRMLHLPPSYKKTIPPKGASVNVSVKVMKMVSIEEITHSTNIQIQINLEWHDERIVFHNLKNKSSENKIDDSDIRQLWLPRVIYENTDQKESTRQVTFENNQFILISDSNFQCFSFCPGLARDGNGIQVLLPSGVAASKEVFNRLQSFCFSCGYRTQVLAFNFRLVFNP